MIRSSLLWIVVGVTSLLTMEIQPGCSGTCKHHSHSFCQEGITYWADSCGNIKEVKEQCACGCDENHSACLACGCTCSQVGDCCDGCHSLYEGEVCDDHDPETINDLCTSGVCAGWNPADIALPALPAEPTLPAPPEPAHLRSWTCPTGWNPVAHATLLDENGHPFSWCEPPPLPRLKVDGYLTPLNEGEQDGDRPICEPAVDGTYPALGFAGCQPLGDPCPAGEWPELPADVTGNRIYVRAGAAGGDGTQAAPFGTIAAAVSAAAPGDVVVVGAGTFAESVSIAKNLTVWGACIQRTTVDPPGPHAGPTTGAFVVEGGAVAELRNLQITGAQIGLLATSSGEVSLRGVWIHKATRHGVLADGGTAQLTGVLVDSTQLDDEGANGIGIKVYTAGGLQAVATTLDWNILEGIYSENAGSPLRFQDLAVRRTQSSLPEYSGLGLDVFPSAQLTCSRCLFDHNRDAALAFSGEGTTATFEDLVVCDTQSRESTRSFGIGLAVEDAAEVTVRRGLIERNRDLGVLVQGEKASVTLEDGVIQETKSAEADGTYGIGTDIESGAQLLMTRALVEHNRYMGICGSGLGTRIELTDVLVRSTKSQESDGTLGVGIYSESGASLLATRLQIEDNREGGIYARDAGTESVVQDTIVRGTQSQESGGGFPYGIGASDGAHLSLVRGLFEKNTGSGFFASDAGTYLELADVTVRETLSEEQTLIDGIGYWAQAGSKTTFVRGLFDGNRADGVVVFGVGTIADLEDLTVRNTQSQESNLLAGRGLEIFDGAQVTVTRGLLDSNRDTGILAGDPGTSIALTDVTVKNTLPVEQDDSFGTGITLQGGCHCALYRVLVSGNRAMGIVTTAAGTTLDFKDITVQDTLSQKSDGQFGLGLQITDGAQCTGQRGLFERNRLHGIVVAQQDSMAEFTDITVRNTASQEYLLVGGSGLATGLGARVDLTRGLFDGNHAVCVAILSPGTSATLNQVRILNTLPRECALGPQPSCEGYGFGIGLGVLSQASLKLRQVESRGSALAGVQLAHPGAFQGAGLIISGNPIGLNIQDVPEGYDFFEAVTGLWMEDNQVNYDSSALPVPDPLSGTP